MMIFSLRALTRALQSFRSQFKMSSRSGPLAIESLETRLQMSVNVLTFHNDNAGDGVNSNETTLSAANVKEGVFGKVGTVSLDGNAYAQPLVLTGATINAGPNSTVGAAGTHDVVFVETMNDTAYAIDTHTYAILWQRSFLNIGTGTGATAGTDVNNPRARPLSPLPPPVRFRVLMPGQPMAFWVRRLSTRRITIFIWWC